MTRRTPQSDVKLLYGLAAARCSFRDCRMDLTLKHVPGEKKQQIGKIAHIVAHSKNGPRADAAYPANQLDTYDNWILLCGIHHDIIDTASHRYTADALLKIKKEHEAWVRASLESEVMAVGFAELEVAASALLSLTPASPHGSLLLIPPRQKMAKNHLSTSTDVLITMGLSRSQEVGAYIAAQSKFDAGYPDRLKMGFRQEYDRLVNKGLQADTLFDSMMSFAGGQTHDFKRTAAGLIILVHLFELCEVFER
jgi:hypothetical protein